MKKIYINCEIIKNYIKENNLTIKRFCEICNIKYYRYRQIVNQDGRVRADALYNVAVILKVSMNDLLGY